MPAVLRHREFRLLWLGQGASVIGDRIVLVALALFVVEETGSATDLGLVLAANTVPLLGFLLLGGVWADRLPRQKLMVVTDLLRGGLHALLAVLIFTGKVEIWHVVVIEACFGAAEAFFRPAYTGLVPQTVPEEEIQAANSLTGLTNHVGQVAGPALATALVLGAGPGVAFAVDAATFLVSAGFLLAMRPERRGVLVERTTVLTELREGWSAVRERPWVWVVVLSASIALLTGFAPFVVLGPTVADDLGDAALYGVAWTCFGVGTVIGAVVAGSARPRHPLRAAQIVVVALYVGIAVFAAGAGLVSTCAAFVVAGIGMALFIVWWETALAQRVPPHLLSRVSSYDWMGSLALAPVGYLAAGPLGEALGAREVLVAGAAIAICAHLFALLSRSVRDLDRFEPVERSPDRVEAG